MTSAVAARTKLPVHRAIGVLAAALLALGLPLDSASCATDGHIGAASAASVSIQASVRSRATLSVVEKRAALSLSPASLDGFCAPGNTALNAYDLIVEEEAGSVAAPAAGRRIVARMRRPASTQPAGYAAAPVRNLTCATALPGTLARQAGTREGRAVTLLMVAE